MFTPVAALLTAILTAALVLVAPIVGAALFGGGATWAVGKHENGKSAVLAGLIGGAVMLLSLTVAQQFAALPH